MAKKKSTKRAVKKTAKAAPAKPLTPTQMKRRAATLRAQARKLEREAKALVAAAELATLKKSATRIRRRPASAFTATPPTAKASAKKTGAPISVVAAATKGKGRLNGHAAPHRR